MQSEFQKKNTVIGLQQHFITHDLFLVYKFVIDKFPGSIGEYFEYIKIGKNDSDFKKLKFKASIDKLVCMPADDISFPEYHIHKTLAEYDEFDKNHVSPTPN